MVMALNYRQIKIWNKLSTNSRRAIKRTKKRYGKPYFYNPRGHLLSNISHRENISIDQAFNDLMTIRQEILKREQT